MSRQILICCGTGCIANGALTLADAFLNRAKELKIDVGIIPKIKKTGCNGFCENGPIITIIPDDITYYKVKANDIEDILTSIGGRPVERLLYKKDDGTTVLSGKENPFYESQYKIALKNTGLVDPASIQDYIDEGGYQGLKKALFISQTEIIEEIEKSELRGRGGAGFPVGKKWRSCYETKGDVKYMICNGDEGDPGAFMDRSILEGDPHSVLEGLIIGAKAIGANQGYFYIRDEYSLAIKHVQKAIETARELGYLGKDILDSGFEFDCEIVRGGGAFVCGESSALMASIEGRVGEPRVKYIRSVEKGLFDKPTVLNNVETLANIPHILSNGADEFKLLGTENSKGTKVFSLVGKVKRTGLVEVPMGITLREIIYNIGGGILEDRPFKAVQTGGPSGGCIPASLLDLPIDFDTLKENGSMMGSGGIIVMDDTTCMVELSRYYIAFLSAESCGKCTPCREGLRCMSEILTRICEGNATMDDLDQLEELAFVASEASLCELGRTSANPVLSTLRYFRDEYIEHIKHHKCSAGVCKKLTSYRIVEERCKGCGLCKSVCPVNAISGEKKEIHQINQLSCIKCGSCIKECPFGAIIKK